MSTNPPADSGARGKHPWIAVLLNAFPVILGLGYLYLGLPRYFLIVFGLQLVLGFFAVRGSPQLGLGLSILWIFSMVHVYRTARTRSASAEGR